MKLNKK